MGIVENDGLAVARGSQRGLRFFHSRWNVIFSPPGIYAAVVEYMVGDIAAGVDRGWRGVVSLDLSTAPGGLPVDYKRSFCCVVSKCLTRVQREV